METLTRTKDLWLEILRRDVFAQGIPTPHHHRPLDQLSSPECEALVIHALNINRRMSFRCELERYPLAIMHRPRSVTWVQFIYARWLLVASSGRSDSLLDLWDLSNFHKDHGDPEYVTGIALPGPVKVGYLDHVQGEVVIALELWEEQ